MAIEIRLLGPRDGAVLANVAADVFDGPVNPGFTAEFLGDARHHLAVALDAALVVGMASAIHYLHPDKAPELWINEVGVAQTHRGQGIGKRLLAELFERGRALGCLRAWVLTDRANEPAQRMYAGAGGVEEGGETIMIGFALARSAKE